MAEYPLHLAEIGAALDHAAREAVPQGMRRRGGKAAGEIKQHAGSCELRLALGIQLQPRGRPARPLLHDPLYEPLVDARA